MDLQFSAEDKAFHREVCDFIIHHYPENLKRYHVGHWSKEDYLSWHRVLAQKGWIAPHWSKEYGGSEWSVVQRYLFDEACAEHDTIMIQPFGITMLGPVLMNFGHEAQKNYYLPRILSGEDWWCQGYSEPNSGSDLVSLRTKAVKEGTEYVVNGHKTWTTFGQHANKIFCLVRTSVEDKPQKGISFLLIDMDSPGVELHPIITIDEGHEVNEVFFTDVRVPVENLVGVEGDGWTIAKFLLGYERRSVVGTAISKREIARIKAIAQRECYNGLPLLEDERYHCKLYELEVDLMALEYTQLRILSGESQGQNLGQESSIIKIKGSEIQQRITELMLETVGAYGFIQVPLEQGKEQDDFTAIMGEDDSRSVAQTYFNIRKTSIYGGTNEIQRNIIAKFVLGL